MDRSRLSRFLSQQLTEIEFEEPLLVSPSDTVRQAVSLMRERSQPSVVAVRDGVVAGIFTERDVLTRCMEEGFNWDQPLEASVLTREPRTVATTSSIGDAIAAIQRGDYRTLPVTDGDGRVVGVVRLAGLLRHLAELFPEEVLNLPPRPHQVMETGKRVVSRGP